MSLDLIIQQLRTYCPLLEGRVAGAADFDTGVESVLAFTDPDTGALAYPSAIVIPGGGDVEPNTDLSGSWQIITESYSVVVEFDATADRRGQAGASQIDAMKFAIFSAILYWRINPDRNAKGFYFAGDNYLTNDRARLFWEFRFGLNVTITDADGFIPRGDPLTEALSIIPVPTPPPIAPQEPAIPIVLDVKA